MKFESFIMMFRVKFVHSGGAFIHRFFVPMVLLYYAIVVMIKYILHFQRNNGFIYCCYMYYSKHKIAFVLIFMNLVQLMLL